MTEALVGETWRVGDKVILQVTGPRVPCVTFAVWMNRKGWLKEFTYRAHPGASVPRPGGRRGQGRRPGCRGVATGHTVTVGTTFRALTLEPDLLPALLEASEYLAEEITARARDRAPFVLFDGADR